MPQNCYRKKIAEKSIKCPNCCYFNWLWVLINFTVYASTFKINGLLLIIADNKIKLVRQYLCSYMCPLTQLQSKGGSTNVPRLCTQKIKTWSAVCMESPILKLVCLPVDFIQSQSWSVCPTTEKYSRTLWLQNCALCSGMTLLGWEVGPDDPLCFLPTWPILCLCYFVKLSWTHLYYFN